jgi:hypothetical protein
VPNLPKPVVAFITAINEHDLDRASAVFADDASVNDRQQDHWGGAAVRAWLAREIIGDEVTAVVTESREHADGRCFVEAQVTGTYDKTGLPDPLPLRFYFTTANDAITQLIILPSKVRS